MTDLLSRFPGFPRPVHSMDTGGGGGGYGDDDQGSGIIDDQDSIDGDVFDDLDEFDENLDDDQSGGVGDDDGITVDASSILGDLFSAPEEPRPRQGNRQRPPAAEGNTGEGDQEPTPQEVQTALTAQLTAGIEGLTIGEDFIPDDFNPQDPKQLRTLLNKVQQSTARSAIALMFAPVQVAMGQMTTQLRREMAENANNTVNDSAGRQLLEANVPAARDPKLRPIVDIIYAQAKTRYPGNARAQVNAVRKATAAMKLTPTNRQRPGNNGQRGQSGKSALDFYAPIQNQQRPQRGQQKPLTAAQKNLLKLLGR